MWKSPASFFLLLFLVFCSPASAIENGAIAYEQLAVSTTASWTFRIAFWRDPDLAALASKRSSDALKAKISLLAQRIIKEMGRDLLASGYGDLSISLIEDYDRLKDERLRGNAFHVLHCDPSLFCLGNHFLTASHEEDPYILLAEEIPGADSTPSSDAGIWVRKESEINKVSEISRRHVAMVNRFSLLGGAVQRATLMADPSTPLEESLPQRTGDYDVTPCGSVSDALYRLATGLASEKPIDVAFLPLEAPGFSLVLKEMGIKSVEDLPFRTLSIIPSRDLPCFLLLGNRMLVRDNQEFWLHLTRFFLGEKFPYRWKPPDGSSLQRLEDRLQPLFSLGSGQP